MEPIPAMAVNDVHFDETTDVVVVGLGAAGASAVVAARQCGADVLALGAQRGSRGTSAHSGGSSTSEAARPSRTPVASRTRPRTCRHSCAPPSARAPTTIASTPTATDRPSTSTGWFRSACRSERRSATSRTVNRPTTPGYFLAGAKMRTPLTRSRSPPSAVTNPSTSTPPAGSSWNASVPPWRAAAPEW